MGIKGKFRKDMKKINTPALGEVMPGFADKQKQTKTGGMRRAALVPVCIVLACLMVVGAAAAAVPAIIRYFNAPILETNTHLTVVPEGYTPIYTAAELNDIRNTFDIGTNYILMNDITFTDADYAPGGICEGGWEPIGHRSIDRTGTKYIDALDVNAKTSSVQTVCFNGIFNGNGYVIRNLKINNRAEQNARYSGGQALYYGLFGNTAGRFLGLGIEDAVINADISALSLDAAETDVYVGAIAASAEFMGSCYVSGTKINTVLDNTAVKPGVRDDILKDSSDAYIGGLCGYVKYVDSCRSDADITVSRGSAFGVVAGVLAGSVNSAVSSFADGSVTAEAAEFVSLEKNNICVSAAGDIMPIVVPEEAMNVISAKAEAYYGGKDVFNYKKIQAYFIRKDVALSNTDERNDAFAEYIKCLKDFGYLNYELADDSIFYVFDPTASSDENVGIGKLISDAFGGKDALLSFITESNIKSGVLYCYESDGKASLTSDDLPGFNFESIWKISDGKPVLRIFG